MKDITTEQLILRVKELETQLEESEQLVEAIKSGEVDAFAINKDGQSEIYTLQSADYTYRLLIEEFGEGAVNVTEDGLIVYTNRYFPALLNLPYEDVMGASIFDFIHPDSKVEFERLFDTAITGKSRGEVGLLANDINICVYISLASLPKLGTIGMIVTDLTEKKKTEKLLTEYQNNLEAKNTELLKNNEELASFVYVASHDLQEPLRKIQTFATWLLESESGNLSEAGKENFGRMQAGAKRMQTLIEDLLTYSRTNTGERKFEDVDLKVIAEAVVAEMQEEIREKKAIVKVGKMCPVHVIPFQFKQLFYNLISNSLKFSVPDKLPHIEIESETGTGKQFKIEKLAPEKQYCHIRLSDDGIGFEQEYSDKIFNVFVRLHGQSEYKGTGIGLSIVKKIVENHSGYIMATGHPDSGAVFDIYIPA